MNHQFFEELLLSDDLLDYEEDHLLTQHLETCVQCQNMRDVLGNLDGFLKNAPDIAPSPGFVTRWQAKLAIEEEIEKLMRHRWQSLIGLVIGANGAVILLVMIGALFFPQLENPTSLFLSLVYKTASVLTVIRTVQSAAFSIIDTVSAIVPIWYWFVLGIGLIASMFLWLVTMKSLSLVPRRIKS